MQTANFNMTSNYSFTRGIIYFIQCKQQREDLQMNMKKDVMVKILEKVARTTVNAAADSRCMWYAHQPKMPADFKKINK